jgi:hypothetical protein
MLILLIFIGMSLTIQNSKVKTAPLLITIVSFLLAAIQLGREVLTKREVIANTISDEKSEDGETEEGWREYLKAGAWIIGLFLAISFIGYLIAIPLFILSYTKSHGIRWKVALALTIMATLIAYGIFEFALEIELYRGLIFELFAY